MNPRRITYDYDGPHRDPEPGDLIVTSRSVYLVHAARLVARRELVGTARRFALVVERMTWEPSEAEAKLDPMRRVYEMRWYPRGSRKRSSNARQRRANV